MMKYAVIGSRNFNHYDELERELEKHDISEIVSGGAKGADQFAERYAQEKSIPIEIIKPDWGKYGKAAGVIRNKEIINSYDAVIAFWDGKSQGTKSSIDFAEKSSKQVTIIDIS
ncbi:MAG: DUF2493 domain-containing protein [Candidatus Marinimicrobia bacterium]|nr:DUF2493 domain-containing protein [Candidatus Neomarinimicrobiota bacterium]